MQLPDRSAERLTMVEQQIEQRGVHDPRVLVAMRAVPREAFLNDRYRQWAYDDGPLPIAANQTISQPFIVASMTEALELKGGDTVLEIGAGSGYAAAVLARIARTVFTVERIAELAQQARAVLAALGYDNVHVMEGDGTLGLPRYAPYDAIVVAAGAPAVPESLKAQLKVGGRLVIPVGDKSTYQKLIRITRNDATSFTTEHITDVRFVPLIGDEGW